ncbi:hypothetical protein BWQ96_04630 [Gracilariopsis chorda]|uniref:Uncharacterized protein n=1 Tax=Gracilariopsis chorda TaxID=448386 RepID=A0A2V3IU41_9FLOR|nr:hypothetical protein BWQ96_04630 [Gracilariopsis chorda]|eukprot:PXF45625.1 hypothetical protein BWQ96_04630 [Gracilariopsis chorda]
MVAKAAGLDIPSYVPYAAVQENEDEEICSIEELTLVEGREFFHQELGQDVEVHVQSADWMHGDHCRW